MTWPVPVIALFLYSAVWSPSSAGHEEGLSAYNLSDFERARVEFENGSALGDPRSMYMLGVLHYRGLGVDRDPLEAMKCYRAAAEEGHALAQYRLGMMHRRGFDAFTRPRSSRPDYPAPSQRLGIAYVEAIKWFTLAANQGLADAQYNLGLMYASGNGIPADFVAAYLWWSVAVEYGSGEAQEKLGLLEAFMTKKDVGKAQVLAREWKANRSGVAH